MFMKCVKLTVSIFYYFNQFRTAIYHFMLRLSIVRRSFAIEKKLFIYDDGNLKQSADPSRNSGVRATIFGSSGFVGRAVVAKLAGIGSSVRLPLNLEFHYRHSQHLKQLRTFGPTHKTVVDYSMNYKDDKQIEKMVSGSNVLVNLLGPRTNIKKIADFEWINIEVPERIAHYAAKHGVHRLIHFSAAGAEPNSPSYDFRTKAEGQKVVLKAFPNATIIRPCPMYGINDHFASVPQRQLNFTFNHFCTVYDDCQAKKQPIKDYDVAQAVVNALKLQESKGKTYEIGGPHVHTWRQMLEIIINIMKIKATVAYVNRDFMQLVAKYIYNWQFCNQDYLRKSLLEEIVKDDRYLTIKDLQVEPVSFKNGVYEQLKDWIMDYQQKEQDMDL